MVENQSLEQDIKQEYKILKEKFKDTRPGMVDLLERLEQKPIDESEVKDIKKAIDLAYELCNEQRLAKCTESGDQNYQELNPPTPWSGIQGLTAPIRD